MEAAERVLEVLSGSFETLQKAVAGRPREQAKRARSEQQMPVEAAARVLEVLSVSFETLQKAPARPRASALEAAERVLEVLSGSFETLQKAVAGRPREPGASS